MSSGDFEEHTRQKVVVSVFMASMGLMALGFCASYGGQSDSARITANSINNNSDAKDSYTSLSAGYGFAAFAFILAFIFFTGVAIYGSPLFCGSQQEKSAVRATVVHQNAAGAQQVPTAEPTASAPEHGGEKV